MHEKPIFKFSCVGFVSAVGGIGIFTGFLCSTPGHVLALLIIEREVC